MSRTIPNSSWRPPRLADRTTCTEPARLSGKSREGHNHAATSSQPAKYHGDIPDRIMPACTDVVVAGWSMAGLHHGEPADPPTLNPGWLYDPGALFTTRTGSFLPLVERPKTGLPKYRVWATERASGVSILIAEATYPLSSPSWGPDGTHCSIAGSYPRGSARTRLCCAVSSSWWSRSRLIACGWS